jgi:ribosomal protein S18 acetylase RimI-like enzyme
MSVEFVRLRGPEYPWYLLLLADPSRDKILDYINDSIVIGLCVNERVVGVVVLTLLQESTFEIMNLAVSPAFQGRGFAKMLLEEGIAESRRRGATRLELGTGNSSISQLALYQKVGFRICGVIPDFFVANYPEPIFENGMQCRDMIRLVYDLVPESESAE